MENKNTKKRTKHTLKHPAQAFFDRYRKLKDKPLKALDILIVYLDKLDSEGRD
jgi:hypothetical protein